mgnify:CR=1 FL=1
MSFDAVDYSLEQLWQENEFRKIAVLNSHIPDEHLAGFLHFCEEYVHIRHPEKGRIPFEPFEAQVEAVASWMSNRYSIVLKARQIGFSTLVAIYSLWLSAFHPDRSILMLSRTERDAIKLLSKAKYAMKFLPDWMQFRIGPVSSTQTKMEFSNGSSIESLPSNTPARGESATLVIVDELAFLPNSDEAWSSIEPSADVGGSVIMLSTANGEGNLFHSLWVEAVTNNNRFEPLFFPWSANGRSQEWYDAKAADLPDWQMAQEYPDNADDAFLRSGRPVFDLKMLRDLEAREPILKGSIGDDGRLIDDGGPLSIWEHPTQDGKYAMGVDVSQGFEHGDYSSLHIINVRNHHVVAAWHGHIDPDLLATRVLAPLGRMYNKALIGVESNTHGLTTLKYLQQQARYFPIYYERSPKYKKSVPTDVLGFRTTQVSKPLIIDGLAEVLREGTLKLWDEATIQELRTFTRDEKGKMSGSPFDDRTMSLAIAGYMCRFVFFSEFTEDELPPPGSIGDWERRTFGESMSQVLREQPMGVKWGNRVKREPIGVHNVRNRSRFG